MKTILHFIKHSIPVPIKRSITFFIRLFFYYLFRIFPVQNNKIFIQNFNGKGYGDNPKYIAEEILRRRLAVNLVWAVNKDSKKIFPQAIKTVNYNSIGAIYEEATAKIWIDNCRKQPYVRKRKNQFYIQTWHGEICGGKKIEKDAENALSPYYVKQAKYDSTIVDLFLSPSKFRTQLYTSSFWYNGTVLECGSPRDDILINQPPEIKEKVFQYFNLKKDTKTILYAPTFRDIFNRDTYNVPYVLILDAMKKLTNQNWVFLARLHPNISKNAGLLAYTETVLNATDYDDMQELMLASDILITDYSGCMYEFALMYKPVFLYIKDYDEYKKERAFYIDPLTLPFPWARDIDTLLYKLKFFDYNAYLNSLNSLIQETGSFENGRASAKVVDKILTVAKT